MRLAAFLALALAGAALSPAIAAECANPDAIGTSRTIVVDPTEHPRVGSFQYAESIPLNAREIVLTLDDGPRPKGTADVLDILAAECIKATYFIIGRNAREFPDLLKRVQAAGHTIGTHTQNHPLFLDRAAPARIEKEVQDGIASVESVLGPGSAAPFVRIPGLLRSDSAEAYLASKGLMLWSTDVVAHDWKRSINEAGIVRRAIDRLEAKGNRGILLLHDIHPRTVAALPLLLRELKRRGYRFVHVTPATPDNPKTPTEPEQWVFKEPQRTVLPMLTLSDLRDLNTNLIEQIQMSGVDFCGNKKGSALFHRASSKRLAAKQRAGARRVAARHSD
ncbi:MAG: polysaccharide deacetylase family protein [Pseudorhodoplanes sp.]|nr:polysaccharide deacetylase family protein [Pseudorhodoplanes sp.]